MELGRAVPSDLQHRVLDTVDRPPRRSLKSPITEVLRGPVRPRRGATAIPDDLDFFAAHAQPVAHSARSYGAQDWSRRGCGSPGCGPQTPTRGSGSSQPPIAT